jgi:hypothetical protein
LVIVEAARSRRRSARSKASIVPIGSRGTDRRRRGTLAPLSHQAACNGGTSIDPIGLGEVLFYNASAGIGGFFKSDGSGTPSSLKRYTDWRRSWTIVHAGNFS